MSYSHGRHKHAPPSHPKTLKSILTSSTWHLFEKGQLTQDQCYAIVSREFGISVSEITKAFEDARESLVSNPRLISLIKELKAQSLVTVLAMSNISQADFAYLLSSRPQSDLSIFDGIYPSNVAGSRKPEKEFFEYVVRESGIDPKMTIFVDDKESNVAVARSLGMQGIVFDANSTSDGGFNELARLLRGTISDPVAHAWTYLESAAADGKGHVSYTNTGEAFPENFAQLLILEATERDDLVKYVKHDRLFNFFQCKLALLIYLVAEIDENLAVQPEEY